MPKLTTKKAARAAVSKRAKPARATADAASSWLIVFAHGAGAGASSPWMKRWKKHLAALGTVVTFDYPYMRAGRKTPDALPKLLDAHREALTKARAKYPDRRVMLAGKSMGSRVGCILSTSLETPVDALLCLGFPLAAPGSGKSRSDVLEALTTRVLFVQGTRDALCPLDALRAVRKTMRAPNECIEVDTGNHSLEITAARARAEGVTQEDVERAIMADIAAWTKHL